MNASELILSALENTYTALELADDAETRDQMVNHIRGIEVREGRGSFVEGVNDRDSLAIFLSACADNGSRIISHEEMEERYPGSSFGPCTYVEMLVPDAYTARNGVIPLQTLLAEVEAGQEVNVSVRRSLHEHKLDGESIPTMEILVNGTREDMPKTNHAFLIVGPGKAGSMIWTWHPGAPASAPTPDTVKALAGIMVKVTHGF
jgi:hypothetical protein|tara:strand:- start:25585 stop:26196 length:612 start_codon:yes stop_codon:yes gene_type:complete